MPTWLAMSTTNKRFLLLYGSQTGQAKAIAEEIHERAIKRGLQPDLYCLSQSEKKFNLEKEPVFVVVVSTTGDGEPPETISKFWRKLKRKTVPKDHLSLCQYALLGLGDSNYTNFCNMGKMLDKRLLELSAVHFYPPGFADDGVGLEIVVEPWIDGLLEPLEALLASKSQTLSSGCGVERPTGHLTAATVGEQREIVEESVSEAKGKTANASEFVDNTGHIKVDTSPSEQLVKINAGSSKGECDHAPSSSSGATQQEDQLQVEKVSPILEADRTKEDRDNVGTMESLTNDVKQTLTVSNDLGSCDDLRTPSAHLSSVSLTLPSVQPPYIDVKMEEMTAQEEFPYNKVTYGFKTSVSIASIVNSRILTREGSVKKTTELEISLEDCPELVYQPGDAFGFICPNDPEEVQWLVERLQLSLELHKLMRLNILPGTTKRNPIVGKHIPNPCSVLDFFTHCADIRCVPKKALLCFLASCCSHSLEARRLHELSSRQGAKDYTELITEQYTNFLDVLHFFPSCMPPLGRLVELLPRLQPRYYSAASSPLELTKKLRIAFNVEQLPSRRWQDVRRIGTKRLGLATGWFDRTTSSFPLSGLKVPLFPRILNPFHLPNDLHQPIIMIGPGTGVSPFIGFLHHRDRLRAVSSSNDDKPLLMGKTWLFFGCRHPDRDFLYKDELESFTASGILTHCHVCFSRWTPPAGGEDPPPRYVQENMRLHWEELAQWIMEESAVVYVCGDAKNMSKDVQGAVTDIIAKYIDHKPGIELNPNQVFTELKESGRYLVDAWT